MLIVMVAGEMSRGPISPISHSEVLPSAIGRMASKKREDAANEDRASRLRVLNFDKRENGRGSLLSGRPLISRAPVSSNSGVEAGELQKNQKTLPVIR